MAIATSAAMASTSAIGNSQLAASKNGVFSATKALVPVMAAPVNKKRMAVVAMSGAPAYVPDMNKRNTVNLLLLGALGLPTAYMAGGYAYFFYPPGGGSGTGGITAKDALGNDVFASGWLATHPVGDRTLTQGLKGDPTYLVVEGEAGSSASLATYGINAVCTHLGCVVPWNAAENKFACPCHGSQYNNQGKVIRGPAPLSLALAHADIVEDKVIFSTWTETDFRTGDSPWWS